MKAHPQNMLAIYEPSTLNLHPPKHLTFTPPTNPLAHHTSNQDTRRSGTYLLAMVEPTVSTAQARAYPAAPQGWTNATLWKR